MADRNPESDSELVKIRHNEWSWYRYRWRWLLDSLEGGPRYRDAVYGFDTQGQWVYNLVRHKREYPDPKEQQQARELGLAVTGGPGMSGWGVGTDPIFHSTDDDFSLRRARTPVPNFVEEAISTHLGTVYSKEVSRKGIDGPEFAKLRDWMEDVDGKGTRFDDWMKETFAPLFLDLGQLDLYFDHPRRPDDTAGIYSEQDMIDLGLDRCLVRYILPESLTWWRTDPVTGQYLEVVVWECFDPDEVDAAEVCWHWTIDQSRALDKDGIEVVPPNPHGYGVVPIVRLFDRRKLRARNVGHSRYESIADHMKEYYNRDSELILSDTTQAHPLLQGPEDFVQSDGTIPIGPSWLLPKKKNVSGTTASYEGFDVVDFPKGAAESIRQNKADIRDEVDRLAHLAKPAGAAGGKVTAQSGVSKVMDSQTANRFLGSLAGTLSRSEKTILEYALRCLLNQPDVSKMMEKVEIVYPTDYDLQSTQDLGTFGADWMSLLEQVGNCPEAEITFLTRYYRGAIPGLDDERYETIDDEVRAYVEAKAEERAMLAEAAPGAVAIPPGIPPPPGFIPMNPDDESTEESEPAAAGAA